MKARLRRPATGTRLPYLTREGVGPKRLLVKRLIAEAVLKLVAGVIGRIKIITNIMVKMVSIPLFH